MSDSNQPTATRGSLLVIFLTVFVDLLGFGIVMPLLPVYGKQLGMSGPMLGLLMAVFSLMQFLFAPLWGRLSDRIGRRPVLIVGLLGSTILYLLFGLASLWKSVPLLFLTRIGAGIAGATIPTAQAYIADCTTLEKRARGMALIGAAFGLGFTFGPLLAAAALFSAISADQSQVNEAAIAASPYPGFVAGTTSGVALLLAIFLLPESLRPDSQAEHRKIFDVAAWRTAFLTPSIPTLLLTLFISIFSFGGFESTLSLFLKDPRLHFGFKIQYIPLFFAYIGVVLMLVQGLLVRRLTTRVPELTLAVAGCIVSILGFIMLTAATQLHSVAFLMIATAVEVSGFAFINPTITALISRRSDPTKQGSIAGLSQSMSALARIAGPLVAMPLFEMEYMAPFGVAILGMLGVLMLLLTSAKGGSDFDPKSSK
jgi:MFS family permease